MSEKALCDVLSPDEFLGGRDYRIGDCYSEHQSTFNNRLHFHSFYEMSIIYEGKTDFLISGNKFSLKNHSIQLVRPSDYHKQMTAEVEYFNILFTPEFISEDMRVEIEKDSDVAAQAGLSPTYFSAVFHKYIGTSFCHYLTDYRI